MNISSSTSAAMAAIYDQGQDPVGTAVLKKAIDIEKQAAETLIDAIPQPVKNAANLPSNLGQNINTTA